MLNVFARFTGKKILAPVLKTPVTLELFLSGCEALGIDPNALQTSVDSLNLTPADLPRMQAFFLAVCENGQKIKLDRLSFDIALQLTATVFAFFLTERFTPSKVQTDDLTKLLAELKKTGMS